MNTRSSTASRKRHMTVDFSSQNTENRYLECNIDDSVIDENSSVESDLKKNHHDSCDVFEEETNTGEKSHEQSFEEKEDLTFSCGVTTRSSSRPGKRQRTISPQRSLNTTPDSSKSECKRLKARRKPQKRQWESWGPKEKDCFFEALLEHSKDFDKIHNYLMNGHKRRGDLSSVVKNKDQVRHFYYRTLNKISKYIPEPPDPVESKKTYHEVHSLICYGELRKKFRSLKEKDGKKLTELISTGKTTVRYHGRNLNIRAPVCRALKKLNPNVVIEEIEPVPNKIMIELLPSDNKSWSTIQGLAQNPRLRTTVSSRKTVCSLLVFLNSKWKLLNNTSITLSPSLDKSHRKAVLNKRHDSETVAKSKQSCEVGNDCAEEERVSDSCEPLKDEPDSKCTVVSETISVSSSGRPKQSVKVMNEDVESCGDHNEHQDSLERASAFQQEKDDVQQEMNDVQQEKDDIEREKWSLSNCSNTTIADLYRKLGQPHKLSLCYSLSSEAPDRETLTTNALEHLVKLAAGEFRCRTDTRNGNKKDFLSPLSSKSKLVSKDCTNVSKPNKVSKSTSKSATKQPKLAPKLVQQPSLVIPSVIPSVINQVSKNTSARSGNHVTFGFTPINSFHSPSPYLPRMIKSGKSRVVVQRTLLPRPCAGAPSGLGKGTASLPSPTGSANSGQTDSNASSQTSGANPERSSREVRQILPREINVGNSQDSTSDKQLHLTVPSSTQDSTTGFCVESLINLALGPDLTDGPENVAKLLSTSSKSVSDYDNVCTEEIDSGVSGGGGRDVEKTSSSLAEAIDNLDNNKEDHCIDQSQDLLDNLKSSEDEDPFKLLSPPHIQQFQPEWLNEESSDFSLSNIFGAMENSPSKQKISHVLDTPKKGQTDFKMTEGHDSQDDIPKYSQPEPVFCDMVDESSVDYVKKFRDLAKKMKNDSETVSHSLGGPSSNSGSTVSFKSLLSEATAKD